MASDDIRFHTLYRIIKIVKVKCRNKVDLVNVYPSLRIFNYFIFCFSFYYNLEINKEVITNIMVIITSQFSFA